MYNKNRALAAYTLSHFCVDFACFFVLYGAYLPAAGDAQRAAAGLLFYNVIAFGLQPIFGYICDKRPGIPAGLIGCAAVLLGVFCPSPPAAVALCALGNAWFHVGGGIDSLKSANGAAARSGVFVSSGALGVSLGIAAGGSVSALIPALLLAASIAALALYAKKPTGEAVFTFTAKLAPTTIIALMCAVIVVRSFAGGIIPMPWKAAGLLSLLPGIASCAGKAAGGILGDRLGHKNVCAASLALSIPLLCLCGDSAALSCIGIALFNMTMPITLCALAGALPKSPGLAFGLSTLALLCGSIPMFFFAVPHARAFVAVLTAISAGLILVSTRNERSNSHETQQRAV